MLFGQDKTEKLRYQREWFDWAHAENTAAMAEALEEGQKIDEIVMDGLTAGSICALGNRLRLFDFLRDNDFDFQTLDGEDRTPLMCAAHSGALKIAAKIMARGDPAKHLAVSNGSGMNALHFAAKSGRVEMIQFFLSKQAHIDAADREGNTALHWSMLGGSAQAVSILLDAGASAGIANKAGQTPDKMPRSLAVCRQALSGGQGNSFSSPSAPSGFSSSSGFASSAPPTPTSTPSESMEDSLNLLEARIAGTGEALFSQKASTIDESRSQQAAQAVSDGDADAFAEFAGQIIAANVDPFAWTSANGRTLFHAFAEHGDDTLSELQEYFSNLRAQGIAYRIHDLEDAAGQTPYDAALANDDSNMVQALLDLQDGALGPEEIARLRSKAIAASADDCLESFDDIFGPQINAPDEPSESSGWTTSGERAGALVDKALDAMSRRDDDDFIEAAELMLAERVDPLQARDEDGKSLAHHLAEAGKVKAIEDFQTIVESLGSQGVEHSLDSLLDARAATPYDVAIRRDNAKVFAALLALEPESTLDETLVESLAKRARDRSATHCSALLESNYGAAPQTKPASPKP